jgi:hypothetical protein
MAKRDWKFAVDNNLTIVNREDLFDSMLDDVYGTVEIAGMGYDTSTALKNVDDVAYRCGVNDYIDSLLTDGDYTELDDGTLVYTSELDALEEREDTENE